MVAQHRGQMVRKASGEMAMMVDCSREATCDLEILEAQFAWVSMEGVLGGGEMCMDVVSPFCRSSVVRGDLP